METTIVTGSSNQGSGNDGQMNEPESFTGPAWNNFIEYPSLSSNEFEFDYNETKILTKKIEVMTETIHPWMDQTLAGSALAAIDRDAMITQLQSLAELSQRAGVLCYNLWVYVESELSIDGTNVEALKAESRIIALTSDLQSAKQTYTLFLKRAPEDIFELYLKHDRTKDEEFMYREERKLQDMLLTDAEEILLGRFKVQGIEAFGQLYSQIGVSLRCKLTQADGTVAEVGLAQTASYLRSSVESERKQAYYAIQAAWKTQAVPCAAILNGLAGWRIEESNQRSRVRPVDFLEKPIIGARIKRETLTAMFDAVQSQRSIGERAAFAIAGALGKSKLDPWDLISSAPADPSAGANGSRKTFKQGISLIRDSLAQIDSSLGDFITTMQKNQWIDGRVLPNKRSGAYCTGFRKSRTPRVFQTYTGSTSDIRTLAHELGHAYHSWAMRDLPLSRTNYPMTLAETASIFAETAFSDYQFTNGNEQEKFEISWQNAVSATSFLMNIPTRFTFEKNFYERRKQGYVPAEELNEMMKSAYKEWYGDSLTEAEEQFWMTKLHFSISGVSFYNFPYTFGYLFSLGIYAKRAEMGEQFMGFYNNVLRDTGTMTAEDLIMKHLGQDITKPEFWLGSLAIVDQQVADFEEIIGSRIANRRI